MWWILSRPSKKENAIELHFQIFYKKFLQNLKKFATKEIGGSYPPQSLSNSGVAYPPNRCFGL
jgi:hypothetical protein